MLPPDDAASGNLPVLRKPAGAKLRAALARFLLACLVLQGFASPSAAQVAPTGNRTSPLGINLREIRYWGTEIAGVDFFKRAANGSNGLWLTQCQGCPWDTGEQNLLDLDPSGWPRTLPTNGPASFRYVTTILVMGTDKFPAGRWTVLYDGEGSLSYGFDAVRNAAASTPGRDSFDVATPTNGITLSITSTDPNHAGNHLRNIRVIPPGGTCNGDPFHYAADSSACPASFEPFTTTYAARPFHPLFLNDMRPFSALRFMHMSGTVTDQTSDWANRRHLTDASWGFNGDLGAPIEFMLDMANALSTSPWLNIPARADDNYVLQYARLARARLAGSKPIYVEYYNEAWNGAWPYSINGTWIEQQGVARWPGGNASNFTKRINWFGLRTKQICQIWKQEFADQPGRVKCVMGAQGANPWTSDQALGCPLHAAEPGGTACNAAAGIDAVATAYYFGGHISDPAFQAEIEADWFTQPDGGLTRLFREITHGDQLTPPQPWNAARPSVALIDAQMKANVPVAASHQVAMVTYEGGNELAPRGSTAYQTALQNLFVQANRDARMGTAYTAVLNQWKAAGGNKYMVFDSTGAYSPTRGNSALLEWQGQPRAGSAKYDAVLTFIENNPCWWTGCALVNPPGAPFLISITRGAGRATIQFAAPADNGGGAITSFTASCSASGQPTRTASGSGSPLVVQGLTGGVPYSCSVTATNSAGAGTASAVSTVTPLSRRPFAAIVPLLLLD